MSDPARMQLILSPKICSFLPPCASSLRSALALTRLHLSSSGHSVVLHLKGSMSQPSCTAMRMSQALAGEHQRVSRGSSPVAAVSCRCGRCRCNCVRRSRSKTTPCSRCRMPVRRSGTWRIPPGSSRLSCCRSTCRTTGLTIRHSAISSTPTTTPLATGPCARCAMCCRGPAWMRCMPIALYVDEAMVHLLTLELACRGTEADRAGHQSRAAASGVDRHRCEERAVDESAAAGLSASCATA